jgi:hypothetical protein
VLYCLKHGLATGKELILFKLIIDFNEALLSEAQSLQEILHTLVPCAKLFYQGLDDTKMQALLAKMQHLKKCILAVSKPTNQLDRVFVSKRVLTQEIKPSSIKDFIQFYEELKIRL